MVINAENRVAFEVVIKAENQVAFEVVIKQNCLYRESNGT